MRKLFLGFLFLISTLAFSSDEVQKIKSGSESQLLITTKGGNSHRVPVLVPNGTSSGDLITDKVQADTITNEAGDGEPYFPYGINNMGTNQYGVSTTLVDDAGIEITTGSKYCWVFLGDTASGGNSISLIGVARGGDWATTVYSAGATVVYTYTDAACPSGYTDGKFTVAQGTTTIEFCNRMGTGTRVFHAHIMCY